MGKLVEIGNCLVDVSQIVTVEPHAHGRQMQSTGAKVTLLNGCVAFEEGSTLRDVKEKIKNAGFACEMWEAPPEIKSSKGDPQRKNFTCCRTGKFYFTTLGSAPDRSFPLYRNEAEALFISLGNALRGEVK